MKLELCATGIAHAEGPTVLPSGDVVFCNCYHGTLGVFRKGGGSGIYAHVGGGPNGSVLGSDGHVYVANNGGAVGPFRSSDFGPGSIQKVSPSGKVMTVAKSVGGVALNMPNDLVFGRDGRLYFTDPGRWDMDTRPDTGRLFALNPDGSGELLAEVGPTYPNGIVAEADGSIVWVETYERMVRRLRPNGDTELLCQLPDGAFPDGLAVAANGDLYITTLSSHGLHIVTPDGGQITFLDFGDAIFSNCVFEGTELYLTDMGGPAGVTAHAVETGKLWRLNSATAGMPMFRGHIAASQDRHAEEGK